MALFHHHGYAADGICPAAGEPRLQAMETSYVTGAALLVDCGMAA